MADLATNAGVTPWGAAALAVGLGACIGLLNAALTFGSASRASSPPWSSPVLAGFTLLYHGASFLPFKPAAPSGRLRRTARLRTGGFPVVPAGRDRAGVLLHRHRLGNRIFAVGANVQAARSSGCRRSGPRRSASP
jgi:hypothetical protein